MKHSPSKLAVVDDLTVIEHKCFTDARGTLIPIELPQILNFEVSRLFWINSVPAGMRRGGHAHKICRQALFCLAGRIDIEVTDTLSTRTFQLARGSSLVIEPGLFASEIYLDPDSALLVLCDRPFEQHDYITDLQALATYRKTKGG